MDDPNQMAESDREARARQSRERYARVRDYDRKLYGDIAAFASTLSVDDLATRAKIEAFCMSIVAQVLDDTE